MRATQVTRDKHENTFIVEPKLAPANPVWQVAENSLEMVKVNDLSPSEAASDLAKIGAILGI